MSSGGDVGLEMLSYPEFLVDSGSLGLMSIDDARWRWVRMPWAMRWHFGRQRNSLTCDNAFMPAFPKSKFNPSVTAPAALILVAVLQLAAVQTGLSDFLMSSGKA